MQIIKINQKNFKEILKTTLKAIEQEKVIVCPTDTVYGLICDAKNKKAVEKLFKIKKRPKIKPIPIFIKDLRQAKTLAKINKKQESFLKSAWPGKVTAVLKRTRLRQGYGGQRKIKLYGVDKKTIALRIPKYKLINKLLIIINSPLTGTSANISNQTPPIKIKEIINQFKKEKFQPDLIIDAGNLPKNKPSTVIDLTVSPPKILRP
ncbi:MAG: tRNA threonylcarbamoyladenosine biosynthesis protein [Candidatus Berkelbacteria bacterium Licking1014_85]|uniref:L-threonylcarbamoyladenylate synthase n=1 Tax=Candidatus Berkelbacteria bacterium Licking1014_85 TaxID=2017148 RepID=A0A554LHT7_9BACT|nr:MAG: tRNA threonylcarbamoyladenosine biosynthesis protein [Candidatus Berkelbacteria bacterium Licking1014_85]